MRRQWLLVLAAVASLVSSLAVQKRDAAFFNVRTHMHKDMSGRKGDPVEKYFHESIFHPHYDGRFGDKELGYQERRQSLSNLIQTYLATFADIGVETWLMHGTLLGWWWNKKIMPWDSDLDVQVSETSMHFLASYYNMSVFHYKTPRIPEGRDYMLEVNPHYVNREQTDKMNVIDARWIDTATGLFIDITTVRYNYTHPAGEGVLSCKDGHEFRDSYLFPLRDTSFEGTPAKIPFAYREILESEYRKKALTMTYYEGHHFDDTKLEWIPLPKTPEPESFRKASRGSNRIKLVKQLPTVEGLYQRLQNLAQFSTINANKDQRFEASNETPQKLDKQNSKKKLVGLESSPRLKTPSESLIQQLPNIVGHGFATQQPPFQEHPPKVFDLRPHLSLDESAQNSKPDSSRPEHQLAQTPATQASSILTLPRQIRNKQLLSESGVTMPKTVASTGHSTILSSTALAPQLRSSLLFHGPQKEWEEYFPTELVGEPWTSKKVPPVAFRQSQNSGSRKATGPPVKMQMAEKRLFAKVAKKAALLKTYEHKRRLLEQEAYAAAQRRI